jgi:WD40 repeat protein
VFDSHSGEMAVDLRKHLYMIHVYTYIFKYINICINVGNIISVFDSHSGERVVDLRGHNSKVRSLNWLQSGSQLLSCGQDGVVYLWDLDGPKRTSEFVKKRTMYTSVVVAQGESCHALFF